MTFDYIGYTWELLYNDNMDNCQVCFILSTEYQDSYLEDSCDDVYTINEWEGNQYYILKYIDGNEPLPSVDNAQARSVLAAMDNASL